VSCTASSRLKAASERHCADPQILKQKPAQAKGKGGQILLRQA
jgi:hypothetical protein